MTSKLNTILLPALFIITGCTQGSVIPYENNKYHAISIGGDKSTVLRMANHDAKVTCKKKGKKQYTVISQEVKYTPPPEIKTGNKVIDTIGKIAAYHEAQDNQEDYEATTVFKCL